MIRTYKIGQRALKEDVEMGKVSFTSINPGVELKLIWINELLW